MSNPEKSKFLTRRARPQTLAGAIGTVMQLFGPRASGADLAARWDQIMGPEIAAVARLVALRKTADKKLTVSLRATNPACALKLSYMTGEIAERINKYFGYPAVAKVTIRK